MADNVSIIFAGYSQAEGGDSGSIWPHQQNIAGMDISCGDTGIASYTCTAELAGSSGTSIAPIGHFCHEFSHFLGLQDLYDTNGEEEGTAPGTYGTLSIMDRGNFLNGGNTPPLFNAVERELLGICTVEDLLPGRSYTLEPATRNGKVYRIGTSNEGEYFLLECRRNVGWDSHIGGSGLVVYHVDKSTRVYGGIASADRWKFNNINCFAEHECVRVISASGVSDKAGGVFFPGQAGVRELGPSGGKMPLRCWAGHPVGIGIEAISYSGGKVSLRTVEERSFSPSLPRVAGCTAIPYQNDIRVGWLPQAPDMENVEGLEWLVEWREKDSGADYSSMVTPVRGCLIQGVVPGCTYEIQVRAFKDNVYGEGSRLIARSIPVTSAFPYIYVDAKGYQEGEEMDLRIVNLVEKHVGVEWFVDGMPVDGTSFLPESAGEVEIMALIFYSDGSNERIYKRIQVK